MSTTASSVHWTSDKVLQVLETFTDSTVLADFPGLTDYCVTLLELQFAVSFLPVSWHSLSYFFSLLFKELFLLENQRSFQSGVAI